MYITECLAYTNIEVVSRLNSGVVHFEIKDNKRDQAISITLNPMQAKEMGEFLTSSALQIIIPKDKNFFEAGLVTVLENDQETNDSSESEDDVQETEKIDAMTVDESEKAVVAVNFRPSVSDSKDKAIA